MSTDNSAKASKKMGRPRVDSEAINVRMERSSIDQIDAWIAANGPPFVSRPEAIRRLVSTALGSIPTLLELADYLEQQTADPEALATAQKLRDIAARD